MSIAEASAALAKMVGEAIDAPYFDYYPQQMPTGVSVIAAPEDITYDLTARRGTTKVEGRVAVILGRESDRNAQRLAIEFIEPHGERSVVAAVAADRTLGGHAGGARIESVKVQSYASAGGASVLFLAFTVTYFVGSST